MAANRNDAPLAAQLDRLESQVASIQASMKQLAQTVPADLVELTKDLHPNSAGTYQTQDIAAPFLYRKQAILASSDSLKTDMDFCQSILQSILIDQPSPTDSTISASSIQQAPILNITADDSLSLDEITKNLGDLQSRVQSANLRVDRMLQSYQIMITAASEALVTAQEAKKSNA